MSHQLIKKLQTPPNTKKKKPFSEPYIYKQSMITGRKKKKYSPTITFVYNMTITPTYKLYIPQPSKSETW